MKRLFLVVALVLGAMAFNATPALAGGQGDPCPVQGGDEGVTVTDNGDGTATVVVEEGFTLTYLCLKAGSDESCETGSFNEFTDPVVGPAEEVFDIPCAKELSHFGAQTEATEGTTTGGTGGGGGEDTTSTSTTGGGGAGGGGGGGGGGAAGGGGSGELPFTGLPILVPLLLGSALLASGIVLLRRGRHED